MRKGERRRTRKRRLRCHWCGRDLKAIYYTSPERRRFCDEECYAEDIEYDAKQQRKKKTESNADRIAAEEFFRLLFGSAFRGFQSGRTAAQASAESIPADMFKKLIFLCHPDKHNNHPWAEEVTKWLLSERSKSQSA